MAVEVPAWVQPLPKAELHLHLEGAIEPETALELAHRHGLRRETLESVQRRYAYRDFIGFLKTFKWVSELLREPADYAFLLRRLLRRLAEQNVLYAEITLAAGVVLWKRQDLDPVFVALRDAYEKARGEFAVEVAWIFDAVRNLGPEHVLDVARRAVSWKHAGVVAFGIGGDEQPAPPELFRAAFDHAREHGLRITVHAGETAGPQSIWGALRALGAERIGHGLAAFQDAALLDYLAEKNIPLEVCLTSNQRTGALRHQRGTDELAGHPVVDYVRRGLRVTLNTDDPGLFETSLQQEYAQALALGLSPAELVRVAEASFAEAFCPAAQRAALLERFRQRSPAVA
ncbi:MAG: adenosine deaminase [Acidobacteria bacterium]|nr:adenosine deaminase [Acidobacteriota bacterium]